MPVSLFFVQQVCLTKLTLKLNLKYYVLCKNTKMLI